MSRVENFRKSLARIFDSDLRTKQWENYVDYVILGLIVLSTLEVFLSTYDSIVQRYGLWLNIVDYATIAIFTIEVSLRIWCADLIDDKYKGFWGRVRYCFSFYGMIDILSTYPFYLSFFMKVPYMALKALRIARLLRVFRYMKSFSILSRAIRSKRDEMSVSLQFLVIVTLILSFVLFFVEHEVQPDVYDNGWTSVVWAFAQYIGDPGGFADTPPITLAGRIIACIIGVLGIAIFAVPAGLIGSGFSEAMDEDKAEENINRNISSIVHSFKFEKDQQHTGLFVVPRFKAVKTISVRKYIPEDEIYEAVKNADNLHLYNLAQFINSVDKPTDKIVVINYKRNTPYGCCIDRGSKVTIVLTSGNTEPCTSWFAYHIAKMGGFNYVSKEVETDVDNPTSYFNIPNSTKCPNLPHFLEDVQRLASRPDSWVISVLASSGPLSRPTQLHFCYNTKKHDDSYSDPASRIKDYDIFDKLYRDMSESIEATFGYKSDKNEWYAIGSQNFIHKIECRNSFNLRVEAYLWMSDNRFMSLTKEIADSIHRVLEPEVEVAIPPEMVARREGHDFGMDDYVD